MKTSGCTAIRDVARFLAKFTAYEATTAAAGTLKGTSSRKLRVLWPKKFPDLRRSLVHRNQTVVNTAA